MKKKTKKMFLGVLLSLIVTTSIFASGANETKATGPLKMKITTWTSNKDQIALLNSFVDEFAEKKGVDIDMSFETIPFAEYTTKLTLELQGSEAPDAFWVLETTAPTFLASKRLGDLSDALQDYDFEDLSKGAMKLWQEDGKTYGVPFSTSPFIMIYNNDLFAEAGIKSPKEMQADGTWTWEGFKEACATITEVTGKYAYQTPDGGGYDARILHNLTPIIRSYGGDIWTENNEIKINSPESVEAITLFHDMLYKDGSVVPPGNQSDFYSGDAAITMGQISRLSKLKDATFDWGIISMPEGPKGEFAVIGQAAICANKTSNNPELAAELVAYMTSKTCVERMSGIWPPARESVMNSDVFLNSNSMISKEDMQNVVGSSIKNGKVISSNINYPQIDVESRMEWDKLWNKNANVQEVADAVAAIYAKYIN